MSAELTIELKLLLEYSYDKSLTSDGSSREARNDFVLAKGFVLVGGEPSVVKKSCQAQDDPWHLEDHLDPPRHEEGHRASEQAFMVPKVKPFLSQILAFD